MVTNFFSGYMKEYIPVVICFPHQGVLDYHICKYSNLILLKKLSRWYKIVFSKGVVGPSKNPLSFPQISFDDKIVIVIDIAL